MMAFDGLIGTLGLRNDSNAQRILRNRGGLASPRTPGTLARPNLSSSGYQPPDKRTYAQPQQYRGEQESNYNAVSHTQSFTSPVNSKQAGMLIEARKYIGTPYRWGGTDLKSGVDCSGFTQGIARQNGLKIPRTASAQHAWFQKNGRLASDISAAKPGDLLYFASKASPSGWHTGIYIGNGKMIDAAGKKSGVRISNVGGRKLRGVGVV